jgi:hypothetical protein
MARVILLLFAALAGCALDVEPTGAIEGGGAGGGGGGGGGGAEISFALDLLPLFEQDCTICHGGAGGLDLQSYEGLVAGGTSGATIVPGDGAGSLLVGRLAGTIPPQMPLDRPPLTQPEIDRIRAWIDQGAQDN